ncbi:hypothetical protein AVEN_237669-1, partial [Araneus ventricosus]
EFCRPSKKAKPTRALKLKAAHTITAPPPLCLLKKLLGSFLAIFYIPVRSIAVPFLFITEKDSHPFITI